MGRFRDKINLFTAQAADLMDTSVRLLLEESDSVPVRVSDRLPKGANVMKS